MRAYNNVTQDRAVKKAQKEWRMMARIALQMRTGRLSQREFEKYELMFTGIYKRLLEDSIEELRKEAV